MQSASTTEIVNRRILSVCLSLQHFAHHHRKIRIICEQAIVLCVSVRFQGPPFDQLCELIS